MLRYSLLTGATVAGGPGKGPRSGLSGQESRRFGAALRQSIRLPLELAGSTPDPQWNAVRAPSGLNGRLFPSTVPGHPLPVPKPG